MCCRRSSGEEALFGRGICSSRRVAAREARICESRRISLMTVSPKRDPVA